MLLPNLSRYYSHWFAIAALLPLALAAPCGVAAPGDTLNLTVGSSLMYDSNVFRLSSLLDPVSFVGLPTRSDQIITSTGTLNFNKAYGMQRFDVSGSIVDNRYHNFDFLNFIGKNYTAAWNWYLTPYFYGTLTSLHREALNNFAGLTGFVNSTNRNLRTEDSHRFDAVLEIDGAWRLIGGIAQVTQTNSRLTVQDFDNRVRSIEGGIRYDFLSGSSLTYKVRGGQGEFINRAGPIAENLFDTRFDEMEHEMRLVWPVTGKTSIDARAAYLARDHAHFPQRDFSGFVGNFNVNWAATGKIRVNAGWARDLSNFQTAPNFQFVGFRSFSSSYLASDRFFFAPIWQITEKTALRIRYEYSIRDFLGAVAFFPENRRDTAHSALIALDWQPLRAPLLVSTTLQRDHRSSNLMGFDFDSAAASVTARLNF
ncbi:MAG: putative exosortase B-associated extracellular polysaccharide biosynthesis transporter EpsL [Pseudomonadota bacterium]|nr:putative exosortase B-associated extracellular polysaccharide biosynthesis transporter EpsL [Pseudomonadota bacterium]